MAFLHGKSAIPVRLQELAVITAADGKDVLTVPFDGYIERVHMYVGTTGATSGNNDATVYYTKPTGGYSTTGDLWTVASGIGRIAYNGTKYLEWDRDSCALYFVERGGTLSLNVDAVAAAGSPADLVVTLFIQPLDRE